jgi:hypothetical protein
MNKAFVREPDQTVSRCPGCQSIGQPVGPQTLNAQLEPGIRKALAESAFFCSESQCDVVYFDDFSGQVTRREFAGPIPIKDVVAPLCSCFGLTRDEIEQDIAEGIVTRTKAAVLQAQSDAARCSTRAPNGRSCVAEIQGYFFKCKQRQSGRS